MFNHPDLIKLLLKWNELKKKHKNLSPLLAIVYIMMFSILESVWVWESTVLLMLWVSWATHFYFPHIGIWIYLWKCDKVKRELVCLWCISVCLVLLANLCHFRLSRWFGPKQLSHRCNLNYGIRTLVLGGHFQGLIFCTYPSLIVIWIFT